MSMRRRAVAGCFAVATLAACAPPEQAAAPNPAERGGYLVHFGGCDDCHTPKVMTPEGPVPDTTRRLSGQPAGEPLPAMPTAAFAAGWMAATNSHLATWAGPWGVSFAANLTPHETGLRSWTDSIFIETMRTGRHMGSGRPLLPPMPWFNLAPLSDDDLRAIFAFLQSLPPIDNQVPTPIPPGGAR